MKFFKRFDEHINNGLILYHGSYSKFDHFDMRKLSKSGSQTTYGYGIYLTDSKGYATSYITGENGEVADKDGYLYFIKPIKNNFLKFEEIIDENNFNLIKKQLKIENITLKNDDGEIIEIDKTDDVWKVISKLSRNIMYNVLTMKQQMSYGDFRAKKIVSEFLARCGIDGLRYPLNDGGWKLATSYGYTGHGYVIYDSSVLDIINIEIIK